MPNITERVTVCVASGVVEVDTYNDTTFARTHDVYYTSPHSVSKTGASGHYDVVGTFPKGTTIDVDDGAGNTRSVQLSERENAASVAAIIAGGITDLGVDVASETATDPEHASVDVTGGANNYNVAITGDTETLVPAAIKTILQGI